MILPYKRKVPTEKNLVHNEKKTYLTNRSVNNEEHAYHCDKDS